MTMIDRPWMTALEMQFAALSVVRKLRTLPNAPRSCTDTHVLSCLSKSTAFAWDAETVSAVWLASKSIPSDTRFDRDLLPDGLLNAWWWLNWPLPLPLKHPKKNEDDFADLDAEHVCALLLSVDSDGIWTISCGRMSTHNFPLMIEVNQLASGVSLFELSQPDARRYDTGLNELGAVEPRDMTLFRFVLAASVWLKQRIVIATSGHIERHRRKQLAREHGAVVPDVKVIALRRPESHAENDASSSEPVEWSCRWIVNGHWRNQFHPSSGKHELKYILPYVKGPEDKPLKVPTHTVYSVNR